MPEFRPVTTVADFVSLDDGDVLEGYLDGFHDGPVPNSSHSRSYWHGWRNGMVDSEREIADWAQEALAREFEQLARQSTLQ
jgi:hypothetical protein